MVRTLIALAAICLTLVPAARAATEAGDAGDVAATAQDLGRAADLGAIDGSATGATDRDMYRLCLSGGKTFSASTVGGTTLDTQLFLFDASGRAVYASDDSSSTPQSTLPSGHALTPAAAGVYHLALSQWNQDPHTALTAPMFGEFGAVLAPTLAGAADPIAQWLGRTAGAAGPYRIALTGVVPCVVPDTAPPAIDLATPPEGAVYERGELLNADFSCADEQDGSGLESCVGTVADGRPIDTATLGERTFTVTATDVEGNSASVTHAYTVVDGDAPTVTLRSPLDGAVYLLDAPVLADYECAEEDGGSGLASCAGDVPSGDPIDTASVGARTFTVAAEDAAGNRALVTATYRVAYAFEGFEPPLRNRPDVNDVRAGHVVRVKFSLDGDQGRDAIAAGYPQSAAYVCGSAVELEQGEAIRGPWWREQARYRRRQGRYVVLWKTDPAWAGSCRQLLVKLADGSVRRADFEFRSKHGHGHGHGGPKGSQGR